MALIKCPDCGKMVSERALSCPFCGCPSEFFLEAKDEIDNKQQTRILDQKLSVISDEKVVFRFGNQEFIYVKKDSDYIKAIGYYLVMAEMIVYISDIAYDKFNGIGEVLRKFPDAVASFLQENIIDVTIELLYRMGDSLSIEQFFRKYANKYSMQYESYYTSIVEKYAEIRQEEAQLAEYRREIKNSRGRWVGGGFGLKGAVKGAITAGMLNCGADFLHSFGDAADERRDSQEIQKKLRELYKNPQTKQQLVGGMRSCILNIIEAMQDEMVEIGVLSEKVEINYGKAVTLYNNTLKWESDEETLYKNMAQCIAYYPAEAAFYQKLEPAIMKYEENDFSSFIDFWDLHDLLSRFNNLKDDHVDYNNWKLRAIIETYYEKYKIYLPSTKVDVEKKKALEYRKHRDNKSVEFADNIKRRLCGLIKNTTEPDFIINVPLYLLRPEFKPDPLKVDKGIDQYVFFDNGEIVITDYAVIINSKSVTFEQVNEIWYGNVSENGTFPVRFMLKNNQGVIDTESKADSTISTITLLNIALEPYREVGYMTEFDPEVADIYIRLRSSEEIQSIDNEEDRKKKKILENNLKKKRKAEVEQYSTKNRTEEEIKISASIRRRFQKLLKVGCKEDNHIVNKYIYELEAENKISSKIIKEREVESDEFLIYENDVYAITDYTLCMEEKRNKNRLNVKLHDINQIYSYTGFAFAGHQFTTFVIVLKKDSEIRKQKGVDKETISIDDTEHKYENEKILYFLNIALEPYRDIDYIPEVKNKIDYYEINYPKDFLYRFEKEKGNFGAFIRNELDDDFDKEKLKPIHDNAKRRVNFRKKIADSYRQEHADMVIDKFAMDFRKLFTYLYEMEEEAAPYSKDITYLNEFRNHYDYEVYESIPEESRKYLEQTTEKGQYILFVDSDVILTDRNVYIAGNVFRLYDIKEILNNNYTIESDEAGINDDWVEHDKRYLIVFRNGKIDNLRFKNIDDLGKVWHPLNYTLKTLHNCDSEYEFLKEKVFFCECCNSFNVTVSEGMLGKKYRCANCGNKSKKKILVGENDENEIDQNAVLNFISQNHMDLKYEKNTLRKENTIVICEYCGRQISPSVKFCNFCGKPVKESIESNHKFCVYCGKEILREAKFCNFCGKPNSVE